MKIAVVGTGISGLVVAHRLAPDHDITVFEAGDHIGGHTHTHDFVIDGVATSVDSGFIVFNKKTYPNFIQLLEELNVSYRDSDMSFSVRDDRSGLEYNGTTINGLFAQRKNLLRPKFWGMLRDVLRFYRGADRYLDSDFDKVTLGQALDEGGFGTAFIEQHILPMGAAVWSSSPHELLDFPIQTFARFFSNHGFLQLKDRPQWLTIEGGSRGYIGPMTSRYRDRIQLRTAVVSVRRDVDGAVEIRLANGEVAYFDRVVLSCHSDQALKILKDADPLEKEILGAIPYRRNEVLIHTDPIFMPHLRRAWSSWNVRIDESDATGAEELRATYWMNRLQGLDIPADIFVTLNDSRGVDPSRVLKRLTYHHPLFTHEGIVAQRRHSEIDGVGGVHYCGAYWGYGFHEDGVNSALAVLRSISTRQREAAA